MNSDNQESSAARKDATLAEERYLKAWDAATSGQDIAGEGARRLQADLDRELGLARTPGGFGLDASPHSVETYRIQKNPSMSSAVLTLGLVAIGVVTSTASMWFPAPGVFGVAAIGGMVLGTGLARAWTAR